MGQLAMISLGTNQSDTHQPTASLIDFSQAFKRSHPLPVKEPVGLIKYITKVPGVLSGAAAEAINKKHAEMVDILMNYMSEIAFEAVVTPDNEESPFEIWNSIIRRYALTSVNNKGHVVERKTVSVGD
ncbi:uncharacterized protein VP01_4940g1 [Puccinia sorghi]|uniref:Uncharacterized protein n=1 Tax=Puccinia sorghi TaxID=27349 RepID=A0A0L6UMS0_9BASI|nr:uncharacterized protein VP01_4940g1 [Puccinia sorghi]